MIGKKKLYTYHKYIFKYTKRKLVFNFYDLCCCLRMQFVASEEAYGQSSLENDKQKGVNIQTYECFQEQG